MDMSFVRVEQRNARLAGAVKVETVKGNDGDVSRGVVTVISNARHGAGPERGEEATAIRWTLWGRQAENAARYLDKGSRVNVIGRLRNDRYTVSDGREVFGFSFTCEELDYLDNRHETEARKGRQEWAQAYEREQQAESGPGPVTAAVRPGRTARNAVTKSNP
jgi:single-strand DNA-binding protein